MVAIATSESGLHRAGIIAAVTGFASCLSHAALSCRRQLRSTTLVPFSHVSPSSCALSPCVLTAQSTLF
ncbi:uncharacterized protein DS421_18g617390 [Arachis hypogaea]|nr:uncharacterized protein DS421_18g617390 [Arachis hypogaea]